MVVNKIGDWTILEGPIKNGKNYYFLCRCKCGVEKRVSRGNLLYGNSSRCKDCFRATHLPSMEGKVFGKLTVVSFSHSDKNSRYFLCKCTCGLTRICNGSELRLGRVKRCKECKKKIHKTHGMKGTSTWVIWMGIKARCLNPNNNAYKNYGGRGIKICDKWLSFEGFLEDMGERPDGLQIDRIDNDGDYCKDNCHWVTPKQNSNNRRKPNESRNANKT